MSSRGMRWVACAALLLGAAIAGGCDDEDTGTGGATSTPTGTAGGDTGGSGGTGTGVVGGAGGSTPTGGSGGSAGGADGGAAGAGGEAGAGGGDCNDLTNTADLITETQETGQAPTLTGGTIPAGTYHLISQQVWGGGHTMGTIRQTLVFTGGPSNYTIEDVIELYGAAEAHKSWTLTTSGSTATWTPVCNATALPAYSYEVDTAAEPDRVRMMINTGSNQYLGTLELQP